VILHFLVGFRQADTMAFLEAAMRDMEQIFSDHCDSSGTMPKSKVATAARILGQNSAQSKVDQLVSRWDSPGITMEQFQEVLSELDDKTPSNEMLFENISAFDIDGEGEVSLNQFKYLMCSSDSGEGLTSEEFDLLLATVKTTEEGMVKISDIVNLLQLPLPSICQ